jgi:hypothetical protein
MNSCRKNSASETKKKTKKNALLGYLQKAHFEIFWIELFFPFKIKNTS